MKNDSELKRKIISLIIATFVMTCGIIKNEIILNKHEVLENNQVLAMNSMNIYNIENDLNYYINENQEVFDFYTKIFGIKLDNLKQEILNDNLDNKLNYNDIGNTGKNYDNLDKNLIDYLFKLRKKNAKLFKQEYSNAGDYNKKYIYGLLKYYTNIYNNVDFDILASIVYIESGNLNSKYMLRSNNIYGGMSSKGLIKYQNIEYGVLTYVKMMSEKYYGKGLNTIEKIANKYNMGSKTWIYNVKSQTHKFNNYEEVNDIYTLNTLK